MVEKRWVAKLTQEINKSFTFAQVKAVGMPSTNAQIQANN